MRSGPSAAITSCSARRQRNRNGGPSGTSATASIGSGCGSSRNGRGASSASARKRRNASQPVVARHLRRQADRGDLGDMAVLRDQPAHAGSAQPRAQAVDQPVDVGVILGAAKADLFGRAGLGDHHRQPRHVEAEAGIEFVGERREPLGKQRADVAASRKGREVPAAMRRSAPSVRNNVSSMRRAPSPRRSSATFSRPASRSTVPSTSSSRAIGSAKRCSAT